MNWLFRSLIVFRVLRPMNYVNYRKRSENICSLLLSANSSILIYVFYQLLISNEMSYLRMNVAQCKKLHIWYIWWRRKFRLQKLRFRLKIIFLMAWFTKMIQILLKKLKNEILVAHIFPDRKNLEKKEICMTRMTKNFAVQNVIRTLCLSTNSYFTKNINPLIKEKALSWNIHRCKVSSH